MADKARTEVEELHRYTHYRREDESSQGGAEKIKIIVKECQGGAPRCKAEISKDITGSEGV